MKRTVYLLMLVFLSLIFVPNVVYAQEIEVLSNTPQQVTDIVFPITPRALEYNAHFFVQENERTYEYVVIYTLPYRIPINITRENYFLVGNIPYGFWRGELRRNTNSYILEDVLSEQDYTELLFRVTLLKASVDLDYPDNDLTPFFEVDSRMYIGIDEEDAYQRGFNAGVKSITNQYISNVLKWTVPFISLVILLGIYVGYKKEWFHSD